jgi:hypothetical protein
MYLSNNRVYRVTEMKSKYIKEKKLEIRKEILLLLYIQYTEPTPAPLHTLPC